jgi:hypothetical protein
MTLKQTLNEMEEKFAAEEAKAAEVTRGQEEEEQRNQAITTYAMTVLGPLFEAMFATFLKVKLEPSYLSAGESEPTAGGVIRPIFGLQYTNPNDRELSNPNNRRLARLFFGHFKRARGPSAVAFYVTAGVPSTSEGENAPSYMAGPYEFNDSFRSMDIDGLLDKLVIMVNKDKFN